MLSHFVLTPPRLKPMPLTLTYAKALKLPDDNWPDMLKEGKLLVVGGHLLETTQAPITETPCETPQAPYKAATPKTDEVPGPVPIDPKTPEFWAYLSRQSAKQKGQNK